MKTVQILFSCDNWHSNNSQKVIGVADCQDMAISMIGQYAKENDDRELSRDDKYNLYNNEQTQGYKGEGEFIIMYVAINSFID